MNTTNPDDLIKEAEKVSSLIATARRLMAENKKVDLSKMEQEISILCQQAEKTGLNHKDRIQGILIDIVEDLKRLNDEITSLYKKSEGSFFEDNTKRAMDAYGSDDKES